ncbi:MAG TPA: M2 family metallopeptidase [Steroidobacteraceae bacterium]|nr:M2 family metallopeptidase [Steroidobacteraceae bacterium]
MNRTVSRIAAPLTLAVLLTACGGGDARPKQSADEFVARYNEELREVITEYQRAAWLQLTYINDDTEALSAKAYERLQAKVAEGIAEAKAHKGAEMSPESARTIELLKLSLSAPAPDDPAKRGELAALETKMTSTYGEGKWCPKGPESCQNIDAISKTLATSRDYDEQLEAWKGWHSISPPMRKDYQRFVELANEGAAGLGFKDLGELWRAGYDMSPADFEQETERLWTQVKPLYDGLHCYARGRLQEKYGKERVPDGEPIPAHLFGNIWAQQWNNIYGLLEPYPGVSNLNVTSALEKQKYDAVRMTKSAESFYTSLGFPELPASFWERSMLTRPEGREVVCHASAHDIDGKGDLRIKQCIVPNEEELYTIYHELGHIFYDIAYMPQPILFQDGAHDGFHEAVGDTINLSMTEGYLANVGLLPKGAKSSREALINRQMKVASEKIAFLPFGKLVDQWRWGVFSGAIPPEKYNEAWWALRRKYQGVDAPVPRSEADFDPGAKYHVPGNTPYTRYFLSFVMQFQFHRALCQKAGFTGPLHECSIYGSKDAGRAFQEMLALGRSKPWQDALQKLTGTRQMDATAIVEYFQPLMQWLEEQNRDRECSWT